MKIFTATLAVGLYLCLAASALAADVPQSRGPQGLPGPGPVAPPVAPAAEVPPSRGPQGLPGPGPVAPPAASSPEVALRSSDEGPSAFTLMLISLGGALALTGVAYIVTRAARHRRAVS